MFCLWQLIHACKWSTRKVEDRVGPWFSFWHFESLPPTFVSGFKWSWVRGFHRYEIQEVDFEDKVLAADLFQYSISWISEAISVSESCSLWNSKSQNSHVGLHCPVLEAECFLRQEDSPLLSKATAAEDAATIAAARSFPRKSLDWETLGRCLWPMELKGFHLVTLWENHRKPDGCTKKKMWSYRNWGLWRGVYTLFIAI